MASDGDKITKAPARLRGADIEIIERRSNSDTGSDVLIPNEVRINGVTVAVPADARIQVHEISDAELVTATITVFVRSLSIRAEDA